MCYTFDGELDIKEDARGKECFPSGLGAPRQHLQCTLQDETEDTWDWVDLTVVESFVFERNSGKRWGERRGGGEVSFTHDGTIHCSGV